MLETQLSPGLVPELAARCRRLSGSAEALAEVLGELDGRALPLLVQARGLTALADVEARLRAVADLLSGAYDPQRVEGEVHE